MIDKASLVINSAINACMSWENIAAMVQTEAAAHNPIASLVVKLDLAKNKMTLQLENLFANNIPENAEEDDGITDAPLANKSSAVNTKKAKAKAKAEKKNAHKEYLVELKPNCVLVDIDIGAVDEADIVQKAELRFVDRNECIF
jgi:hypothetical protein